MMTKVLVACVLVLPVVAVIGLVLLQRTPGSAKTGAGFIEPRLHRVLERVVDRSREVTSLKETMTARVDGEPDASTERWFVRGDEYSRSLRQGGLLNEFARVGGEAYLRPPGSSTWLPASTSSEGVAYSLPGDDDSMFSALYHFHFGLLSGVREVGETEGGTIHLQAKIEGNRGQEDVSVDLFIEADTVFLKRMELRRIRSGREDHVIYEFTEFNQVTHLPETPR